MTVSFVPFNANDHRASLPLPQSPISLRPQTSPLDLPAGPKPALLPDPTAPKPLDPSFKDLYIHKREELHKSAEGMESMLVRQVLKAMRSTIPEPEEDEDLFGSGSHATKMFTQMMDDQLSDQIADHSELGIAEKIFKSHINTLTEEFAFQLAAGQSTPFGLPLPRR